MASPILALPDPPALESSPGCSRMSSWDILRTAYRLGYRVTDDGEFISKTGREISVRSYGGRPPMWSLHVCGARYGFLIHRLAAYCFFGEAMFAPGIQVRHLNCNILDISRKNLALGTARENYWDTPAEVRSRATLQAVKTRELRGYTPSSAVFSPTDIDQIRTRRKAGESCDSIGADIGAPPGKCGMSLLGDLMIGYQQPLQRRLVCPHMSAEPRLSGCFLEV